MWVLVNFCTTLSLTDALSCLISVNSRSQVGVVVISRASHLYDPGSSPHVGWDLSISIWLRGFSFGFSSFPPSGLSCQDLSCRAIKHQPLARKNGQLLPSQLTLNKVFIIYLFIKPFLSVIYCLSSMAHRYQQHLPLASSLVQLLEPIWVVDTMTMWLLPWRLL